MLSSQMLKNVQELRFSVNAKENDPEYYSLMFSAIESNLNEIQKLTVQMEFNLFWVNSLSTLPNLQQLTWYLPKADLNVTENAEYTSDAEIVKECGKVFEHITKKPVIKVETWKGRDSGFEKLWNN